jgi:predicted extracellular nuclease
MSHHWIVFVAVLLLVFSGPVASQDVPAVCDDGQCIQIGTYNLELFGKQRRDYGGMMRGPRTDEQIDRIADRIATQLDLEVVVFQEINTESDQWARLKAKLQARGYDFFEGTTSDREQFVVLAWQKQEVTPVGTPRQLDVDDEFAIGNGCNESGLRKPVLGRFKAGAFDFWVIGVHLKSRSGVESCTSRVRRKQCEQIVEQIDRLRAEHGENDFILTGDFNENIGHDSFTPLVDAGFISQMKFRKPESGDGSYVKTGSLHESDDLIDHVWLRYADTKEVVRNSAFVMKLDSQDAAKRHIIEESDHVPAWASFRIDEDLDDEDD